MSIVFRTVTWWWGRGRFFLFEGTRESFARKKRVTKKPVPPPSGRTHNGAIASGNVGGRKRTSREPNRNDEYHYGNDDGLEKSDQTSAFAVERPRADWRRARITTPETHRTCTTAVTSRVFRRAIFTGSPKVTTSDNNAVAVLKITYEKQIRTIRKLSLLLFFRRTTIITLLSVHDYIRAYSSRPVVINRIRQTVLKVYSRR